MSGSGLHHRLDGLEPDNLLAFLALLGLLRSLESSHPEWRPRVAWDLDRPPLRPVLILTEAQAADPICQAAADGVDRLATSYEFPSESGGASSQRDLNYTDRSARRLLANAVSTGDRQQADLWAALMCDAAAKDGKIEATPLCLLFGQGHQHFLERLTAVPRMPAPPPRGRGRQIVTISAAQALHEALFQPWTRQDATPAFRWDPAEDVRYALRASDPSDEKSTTQHGANRLAALGLAVLTAAPEQRGGRVRLQVLGSSREAGFALYWPIWRDPASLTAIRAMLSHPRLSAGPTAVAHLGVVQVRRTRRISVGKFMNFTWADAVGE
jgi:hypothetical protein